MSKHHSPVVRRFIFSGTFAVLLGAGLFPNPVHAQTSAWDGGSLANDFWTTPANWAGDAIPLENDSLVFDGAIRLTPQNDFAAGTQFSDITFGAAAGAFQLNGSAITLAGNITSNSVLAQTINLDLVFAAVRTVDVTALGSLTINGAISGPSGGIEKTGGGTLILTGANTYAGPTSIGTTADGGTLEIGAGGTLGDGTGALTLGGGTFTGNLNLNGNSATAASLTVSSNTTVANTITIAAGRTLQITGDVTVGGLAGSNTITGLNVTGGGSLEIGSGAGGVFYVGNLQNGNGSDTTPTNGKLDLSGLATFVANYGAAGVISVGAGSAGVGGNAPFGELILGANNTLTAGTLAIGLNTGGGNVGNSTLRLGTANIINIDNITVGAGKTRLSGGVTIGTGGRILFADGLTDPSVTLRGSDGTSRVSSIIISDGQLYTASSPTSGVGSIDFTGGTVNALIDNLTVAVGVNNTNTAGSTGTLTFDKGIIDANTVTVGVRAGSSAAAPTTGTINVNGTAQLVVGLGGMKLADTSVGSSSGITSGRLNINGGTVTMGGDIIGGGGASAITLIGGTLNMGGNDLGTADGAVQELTLTSGTLQNVGEIHVGTLTKNGTETIALTATALTGDVTVAAGTLVLTASFLDSTTDVSIATGAKLQLSFLDTNVVSSLTLAGVLQEAGSWGASGSGADHISDDFFSGTGTLTVVPEPGVVALALVGIGFLLYRRRLIRG